MAKILTDRTSVRVTAKSETDANNQKKNDANNIAKALGKNGDLDDAKASSVASKLGNTITDEDGTTWAKSSEVAAAAKELDGEIGEKEIHKGLEDSDGTVYNFTNVYTPPVDAYINPNNPNYKGSISLESGSCYVVFNDGLGAYAFSKESFSVTYRYGVAVIAAGDPTSVTINDISYSFFTTSLIPSSMGAVTKDSPGVCVETNDNGWGDKKCAAGYLFGAVEYSGSKIDTSKSEDQIKDELESKAWAQGKAAKINPIEPNETYIAVTDANGNPLYFLGT